MARNSYLILVVAGFAGWTAAVGAPSLPVMPMPAETEMPVGQLRLPAQWKAEIGGADQARVRSAWERTLRRWAGRSGQDWQSGATGPSLVSLFAEETAPAWPQLGEDESYTLTISSGGAILHAPNSTGIIRGLSTLEQLLQSDATGWFLPELSLRDRPRFAWRGLLIDVSRHWQPVGVIERNLDGMALVKLNVLHWHLTDDQGFRVESRIFPRLQAAGSDGLFYTQEQIREVVAYAAARGIRVVPEFDLPGHSTSWLVAYPDLASGPGPFSLERDWGIYDPVFDPSNDAVYPFLDRFVGEMTGLFPDAYFHIGGDEVNGREWNSNPRIRAFIQAHGLSGNEGLQTYFNRRLQVIVSGHGRRMVGWDEIFHPGLPKDTVIQSWRGLKSLAESIRAGYSGILSTGYYLDHLQPAGVYYANDPIPADSALTSSEQQKVLGGEAAMWGELISEETIDGRIWPAAAAVAERLWSPATVKDEEGMYCRLASVTRRLEEAGIRHEDYRLVLVRRFAGDDATAGEVEALANIVDILEPQGLHGRRLAEPLDDQFTPLTGLADCARPESEAARLFHSRVRRCLLRKDSPDPGELGWLRAQLEGWGRQARVVAGPLAAHSLRVAREKPLIEATAQACEAGLTALSVLSGQRPVSSPDRTVPAQAGEPSAVRIAILPAVQLLADAAESKSAR